MTKISVPRIENLKVQNYRALQNLELKNITPLTVFLGPNGSGKSTIFDVFAFLSECFTEGLRKAWDRRGRFRELRTRGSTEPIIIEIKYRETKKSPKITYHLAVDEENNRPFIAEEWLHWRRGSKGKPFRFLDFKRGEGQVISGEMPDEEDERISEQLESPEFIAVNTLGQFAKHPRVSALRRFITGWYLSYLSADNTRSIPEAGAQERLSATGDNLPNVIQYLKEQYPQRLEKILKTLSMRIPRLEKVEAQKVGLITKTSAQTNQEFQVLNRIIIEELEAWFFGDINALRQAYPKVSPNLAKREAYRNPDTIKGGTWEALERVLKRAGYHQGGLEKYKAASEISPHMNPSINQSKSFQVFSEGLLTMLT